MGHLENPAENFAPETEFVVTGSGFGDTKGWVYLKNINITSNHPAIPFDSKYSAINPKFITSWTNTEIRISTIPSDGYAINIGGYGLGATPGTGQIAVQRPSGIYKLSNNALTVRHSITNKVKQPIPWNSDASLQQYYELRNHDFVNDSPNYYDFKFVYDPAFYENKPAYTAFHRALETWRKSTGVRFTERCGATACNEATSNQVAVYFDTETTANANCYHTTAQAQFFHQDVEFCDNIYFMNTAIVFDPSPGCDDGIACTWDYDSPNGNETDLNFENYALHELGHLLGLDHVINELQIMRLSNEPGHNTIIPLDIDVNNITTPHENDIEGVNYTLGRDAIASPDCLDYPPLGTYPLGEVPEFPTCSDLCPTPDPSITPDFAAYYIAVCDGSETLDAIYTDALVGQEIYLQILDLNPDYSYEWLIDGNWAIDSVFEPDDYSYFTLHWNESGEFVITLEVDNGATCSAVAYTITIHDYLDCQMAESPIAAIVQPTDCATGTGGVQFTTPTMGSGCFWFAVYSLDSSPPELLYESDFPGDYYGNLVPGSYAAYMEDTQTGCYNETYFDIETHNIAPQVLSACGGGLGSVHLNIADPNNYTYIWSNGNTAQSLINVVAGSYTVTVTAIGGCSASATVQLTADTAPCFVDLRMRDNWNDIGQEPNTSSYQDDNGDGWLAYGSNDDWEDIWASPDLWDCPDGDNCHEWERGNPTAAAYNQLGFSIHNSHPNLASEPATLHLYYSLANTGEVWQSDWVNNNYEADEYTCRVGNEVASVAIPAIAANGTYEGWSGWTPPNYINNTLNDYISADACGLITEIDPIDTTAKYEICLLARLESAPDPINGEQGNGTPIRDNVLNSNNIVTRNTFLVDPSLGGSPGSPVISGHPSIILVMNNNDEVRNLDILFDKISNGSVEALQNLIEISWILSPDLWAKWESTGKQGEGIEEIGEREVKITNMETAKLLNIPFDPREFQPLAIKVTILNNSGKREQVMNLPNDFGFRITHQSSDGSPIKKPSNCLFELKDIPNLAHTAQLAADQLICSPNPFSSSMNVQFWLDKTASVTLALYDLQGRLVKTMVNQQILSKGEHNISLESNNLANGVYICSLITPGKHAQEKVVLLK